MKAPDPHPQNQMSHQKDWKIIRLISTQDANSSQSSTPPDIRPNRQKMLQTKGRGSNLLKQICLYSFASSSACPLPSQPHLGGPAPARWPCPPAAGAPSAVSSTGTTDVQDGSGPTSPPSSLRGHLPWKPCPLSGHVVCCDWLACPALCSGFRLGRQPCLCCQVLRKGPSLPQPLSWAALGCRFVPLAGSGQAPLGHLLGGVHVPLPSAF